MNLPPIKMISWNVNGIRAIAKKNFFPFIEEFKPDILALQETKAHENQLGEEFEIPGYQKFFASSTLKKGYSGVAIFSKIKPIKVSLLEEEIFDREGRGLIAEYDSFFLINGYFPNSQEAGKRLDYKIEFLNYIASKSQELRKTGKHVIICGDYNIAHKEIDLANPKANENSPGYLKEEREWISSFLKSHDMVDTYRFIHPEKSNSYSWWSYKTRARERNIGWRIDYFCISEEAKKGILEASILSDILGSDHAPVQLTWNPNLN